MSASVQLNARITAHADRPGIATVFVGDDQVFQSGAEIVLEVTVLSKVPISLTVGDPTVGVAYRVP